MTAYVQVDLKNQGYRKGGQKPPPPLVKSLGENLLFDLLQVSVCVFKQARREKMAV